MNISFIHDCFGCGVCALACRKNIIDIRLNREGFYEPVITAMNECTDCGLCVDVCSYSHSDIALRNPRITSYGAWSDDPEVRRRCSSGGVGFESGRAAIRNGYKVCGVRYNPAKNQAEHYIASDINELIPSIGSKYIQSYTVDGFKSIDRSQKYLVTGTPCQIDSFRRYIRKFRCEENFILLDFFCHGVPSRLLWDKYVAMHEPETGKPVYVSWRSKRYGWHDSYLIESGGSEKQLSPMSRQDLFYKLFLGDLCLGKACYDKCRFKYDQSSADIRIGDAWGSHYQEDEKGVSAVITFTEKGHELLKMCQCVSEPLPFDVVAEGQMRERAQRPPLTEKVMRALMRKDTSLEDIKRLLKRYYKVQAVIDKVMHPIHTLSSVLNSIT
jgi:coenzyme F420-reducing hydrogenase beta subunit